MTVQQAITAAPVKREVRVKLPPAKAFEVFTARIGTWWPRDKSIAQVPMANVIIEPRVGGRWYEESADGSQCDWGAVLAYQKGERLMLNWQIDADWKFDPDLNTEVEILFKSEGTGTLVTLEHRNIENFGPRHALVREMISSEGGWTDILRSFGRDADA
jgi:uncharacterized protein YndB with AHSA1/START domain